MVPVRMNPGTDSRCSCSKQGDDDEIKERFSSAESSLFYDVLLNQFVVSSRTSDLTKATGKTNKRLKDCPSLLSHHSSQNEAVEVELPLVVVHPHFRR